jgi:hypothetical protein
MALAPVELTCEHCNKAFNRPAKLVNFYKRAGKSRIRFCSRQCKAAAKSVAATLERDQITSRVCSWCHTDRPIEEFSKKNQSRRNTVCQLCMRAYCRSHYVANREKAISRAARNRPKYVSARVAFITQLKEVPCADCGGVFDPRAMDFDHLDASLKLQNVSSMRTSSWVRIQAEISKCEVVCSNCHRIRTFRRLHTRVG